jgi:hypothetical protein
MPEIDLRIDAIAFTGFGGFDAEAFSGALGAELARLVSELPPAPGAYHARGVTVDLPAGASAAQAGVSVARALHAGMRGGRP